MKSNKEIKENLSTEAESIKRGLKDIKEGRTFTSTQINAISELLKIKDKEYSQKLKELEQQIKVWKQDYQKLNDNSYRLLKESETKVNQLKSKLNSHTGKIKELIKHFDFIGSGGDNYAKYVVKRLKSLLESEKDKTPRKIVGGQPLQEGISENSKGEKERG